MKLHRLQNGFLQLHCAHRKRERERDAERERKKGKTERIIKIIRGMKMTHILTELASTCDVGVHTHRISISFATMLKFFNKIHQLPKRLNYVVMLTVVLHTKINSTRYSWWFLFESFCRKNLINF